MAVPDTVHAGKRAAMQAVRSATPWRRCDGNGSGSVVTGLGLIRLLWWREMRRHGAGSCQGWSCADARAFWGSGTPRAGCKARYPLRVVLFGAPSTRSRPIRPWPGQCPPGAATVCWRSTRPAHPARCGCGLFRKYSATTGLATVTVTDKDHGRIETRPSTVSIGAGWPAGDRRRPGEHRLPGLHKPRTLHHKGRTHGKNPARNQIRHLLRRPDAQTRRNGRPKPPGHRAPQSGRGRCLQGRPVAARARPRCPKQMLPRGLFRQRQEPDGRAACRQLARACPTPGCTFCRRSSFAVPGGPPDRPLQSGAEAEPQMQSPRPPAPAGLVVRKPQSVTSTAGLKLFAIFLGPAADAVGHVKKPGLFIVAAACKTPPAFVVGQILVAGI